MKIVSRRLAIYNFYFYSIIPFTICVLGYTHYLLHSNINLWYRHGVRKKCSFLCRPKVIWGKQDFLKCWKTVTVNNIVRYEVTVNLWLHRFQYKIHIVLCRWKVTRGQQRSKCVNLDIPKYGSMILQDGLERFFFVVSNIRFSLTMNSGTKTCIAHVRCYKSTHLFRCIFCCTGVQLLESREMSKWQLPVERETSKIQMKFIASPMRYSVVNTCLVISSVCV